MESSWVEIDKEVTHEFTVTGKTGLAWGKLTYCQSPSHVGASLGCSPAGTSHSCSGSHQGSPRLRLLQETALGAAPVLLLRAGALLQQGHCRAAGDPCCGLQPLLPSCCSLGLPFSPGLPANLPGPPGALLNSCFPSLVPPGGPWWPRGSAVACSNIGRPSVRR